MIFTSDLMNPEGPVFLADGSLLVVEGTRGTVTQIMPGGQPTRIIATTGEPNGLAVDRRGTDLGCRRTAAGTDSAEHGW